MRLTPGGPSRAVFVRPTPMRFVAAALGLLVILVPAAGSGFGIQVLGLVGAVLALLTIVVYAAGLPTAICSVAMLETAFAVVHRSGAAMPMVEGVVLLVYLVVADLSLGEPAEIRVDGERLATDAVRTLAGGIALMAVVVAFAFVRLGTSFVAVLGAAAALGAVVALRWMLSD